MNEKGQSWPEAMLSLFIVMTIFGSLLPMSTKLTAVLDSKKQSAIAAETGYQAAVHYRTHGRLAGSRVHEGRTYDWVVSAASICVTYASVQKEEYKCIEL